MAGIKCPKCGADIPAQAAFCPACGAPKAVEQSAPEPTPQPAPQSAAPAPVQPAPPKKPMSNSLQGLADTFFSKLFIMLGLAIGILLAFISRIIMIYNPVNLGLIQISIVLNMLAFSGISFLMIGGGLANNKLQNYVRAGLIGAGGIILVFALASTSLFGNLFGG